MKTDITLVLDRSGSMRPIVPEVIGSINTFIEKQKEIEGEADVTLVLFDDYYETVFSQVPIEEVPVLTTDVYNARGMTALNDAIGKSVSDVKNRVKMLKKKHRPDKIVIVVQTDGMENASKEWTPENVKGLVKKMDAKDNWEIIFLGANMDAQEVGMNYGFAMNKSMTFDMDRSIDAFASISSNLSSYRSGEKSDMSYTEEDRQKQK